MNKKKASIKEKVINERFEKRILMLEHAKSVGKNLCNKSPGYEIFH